MNQRIDKLAYAGYDYATSAGKDDRSSLIETDMDLLAFNAGITNANTSKGLSVIHLTCKPTGKRYDSREGRSDKDISVIF